MADATSLSVSRGSLESGATDITTMKNDFNEFFDDYRDAFILEATNAYGNTSITEAFKEQLASLIERQKEEVAIYLQELADKNMLVSEGASNFEQQAQNMING